MGEAVQPLASNDHDMTYTNCKPIHYTSGLRRVSSRHSINSKFKVSSVRGGHQEDTTAD